MERYLESKGKLNAFQGAYVKYTGLNWLKERDASLRYLFERGLPGRQKLLRFLATVAKGKRHMLGFPELTRGQAWTLTPAGHSEERHIAEHELYQERSGSHSCE
jgi:hypothetical protein